MKKNSNILTQEKAYRKVFILESRAWWSDASPAYDASLDLVLTYDYALRREITAQGGDVFYVDHLCDQAVMQENNFRMYQFFKDWHFDENGADIFRYREVDFGFSFRIEIWNDFTFYVRAFLCLETLKSISYKTLFVGCDQKIINDILEEMGLEYEGIAKADSSLSAYYFPIHRWMDERLRSRRLRQIVRDAVVTLQGRTASLLDLISDKFRPKRRIFIQEYHPTRKILQSLKMRPDTRVIQGHFSGKPGWEKFFKDRPIPVFGNLATYRPLAQKLIDEFRKRRSARLILSSGIDVSDAVFRVIDKRISGVIVQNLRALDCVLRYLEKHPLNLEILIANIGQLAMLVDCVSKKQGVPSYLIINGLLGSEYLDEGKYATVINSYSTSIRDHYFRGMENVVCLGDPRMDDYARSAPKAINRIAPTVTIGASGFSNIDLNSFLAIEFEFLGEVLEALSGFRQAGKVGRVVLKVRANGYAQLYSQFIDEYFAGQVEEIVDNVPMQEVLEKTDLFISIYSQTLFEASCLGIPAIYHKNDCEIIDPPFDGNSELVTTGNVSELKSVIEEFLAEGSCFDAFLRRETMEKYIGPLDGGNLERNLIFVETLLGRLEGNDDSDAFHEKSTTASNAISPVGISPSIKRSTESKLSNR